MTLEEQKLAVCEKLPELIVWRKGERMSMPYHREGFFWRGLYDANNLFREINWPTEGLQVCFEAEKLLTERECLKYDELLWNLPDKGIGEPKTSWSDACTWNANYEQRLEALCRVWWPERFE